MQGRVLPIKVYASDSLAWTLEYAAVLILFAFSISCGGECLPITACAFDPYPFSHSSLAKCLTSPRPDCFLPLVLIFCAFGTLYGEEFYLSRFTNLILRLCYLDLWSTLQSLPSVLAFSPRFQSSPSVFHAGESLLKYHVFGPEVTIMQRVFNHHTESILSGKNFHLIGRLSYPGRLCYFHWLSYVLPLYLERKASHPENIL